MGVQIVRDYLTYGISANGFSTEAVGYTQFGLVWANPFHRGGGAARGQPADCKTTTAPWWIGTFIRSNRA